MAYPVNPFGLRPIHLHISPPISDARRSQAGERPGLFGQFNDCQANQFQEMKGRHHFIFFVCLKRGAGAMKRPKASFQLFDANRQRISYVNVRHSIGKEQTVASVGLRSSHHWAFFAFHNKNFSGLRGGEFAINGASQIGRPFKIGFIRSTVSLSQIDSANTLFAFRR